MFFVGSEYHNDPTYVIKRAEDRIRKLSDSIKELVLENKRLRPCKDKLEAVVEVFKDLEKVMHEAGCIKIVEQIKEGRAGIEKTLYTSTEKGK